MEENSVKQLEQAAQVTKLDFIHRLKKPADEYDGKVRSDFTNMEREREREAVRDLTWAIRLGMKDPGVYAKYGDAYRMQHEVGKAIRDLNEAISPAIVFLARGEAYLGGNKYVMRNVNQLDKIVNTR